jgi:hypothetical protein
MFGVGGVIWGEDKEVVHVNDKPSFGNHVLEGIIHESLEGGRRVVYSKEHDGGFEESFMSNEGAFPLVAFFDADIVISPLYVELGKDFDSFEFINEVGD